MKQYHLHGYHVGENGVVFISNAQEKVETALDRIKNNVEANYEKETIVIKTKVLTGDRTIDIHVCKVLFPSVRKWEAGLPTLTT